MQVCFIVILDLDVIFMTCGLFSILHRVLCVLAIDPGTSTECTETWTLSESGRYRVSRLVQICVKSYERVAKHIAMSPKRAWNKQKLWIRLGRINIPKVNSCSSSSR